MDSISLLNKIGMHYNLNKPPINKDHQFCNFTGLSLEGQEYIHFRSGENYLLNYFERYITFLYQNYEHKMKVDFNDDLIILTIDDIIIKFDLCFNNSFHHYIKHPYPKEIRHYLIYDTYGEIDDVKPFLRNRELKILKSYFIHGSIVSTRDHHYILKNNIKKKFGKSVMLP